MTVVVDPGSGPSCITTPQILTGMGCRVFTVNGIMDGTFPGRLPEPSPEGLRALSDLVVSCGAAFGVAHDGDADRSVFIDEKGQFVEENQEFALIARHICHQKKGILVTPVSTSQMVELVAENEGCTVRYTPVGSIYVARTMRSLIDEKRPVVFGGEGNGGLIFPDHQFCRDGGMTAAMMVFILSSVKQQLSTLVNTLPQRTMIKDKIRTTHGTKVLEEIKRIYSNETLDLTDGVKIIRKNSWALVRASGTEPIMRVIIDAECDNYAKDFHNELMAHISQINIE
jgi:phosphomannomutase/phosphoglucomutase